MKLKSCWGCKSKFPQDSFNKNKAAWDGLQNLCRDCSKRKAAEKRQNPSTREKILEAGRRQYRTSVSTSDKRNKRNERARLQRIAEKERMTPEQRLKHKESNKRRSDRYLSDPIKRAQQNQKARNKLKQLRRNPTIAAEMNRKIREREQTDICFKLANRLRNRLYDALKNGYKNGSAIRDCGTSLEKLKIHIESLFVTGMGWHNWGKGEGCWNIDHIMPLAAFNLEDRQHFLLANHYLNLQPMWAIDNLSKSDTIPNLLAV